MVEVTLVDTTIQAVDVTNSSVQVDTVGWDQPAPEKGLPYFVDATVSGRATELFFPHCTNAEVANADATGEFFNYSTVESDSGEPELPTDSYVLRMDANIQILVRFDEAATITFSAENELTLSFEHPTSVTIGFLSLSKYPRHTVTVPPTTGGIATALTYASASVTDTEPDRAAPMSRGHPPAIEYGAESIPEPVVAHATQTNIELYVPDELEYLFPTAPLAYYLGATVHLTTASSPYLSAPDVELHEEFSPLPSFQFEVGRLLRRVVLLDNLVRFDQYFEIDSVDVELLTSLDFDPEWCRTASLADRLQTYLDIDYERIEPGLPPWHSLTVVEPTLDNAQALPFMLADLQQIFIPGATEERGTNAIPPGTGVSAANPNATIGAPEAPFVGWLTSNPPDGAYRPMTDAYVNKSRYLGRPETECRVILVRGRDGDRDICDSIAAVYRDEYALPVDLEVHDDPSRAKISKILRSEIDLFHYLGDCEDGLSCADGRFRLADLEQSNTKIVYLDGPASLELGRSFVERGSVAAIVHTNRTQSAEQADFRQTFLRLLTEGVTLDRGLRYATRYGGENDAAVIGDGTTLLVRSEEIYIAPVIAAENGDGTFRVTVRTELPEIGYMYVIPLQSSSFQLSGNAFEMTVDAAGFRELLGDMDTVVVHDDVLYRDDELAPFYPII
ncbi:hypothetical protein [Natrononativus amylolyticus]|uniref:hypothetical protein n=1 Tax=Natrononativus amylolyticus TaxID=2963434 RepID=UPI0020CBBB62|nr:hypothetical protein [Natrononativus amylolyticus]